MQPWLAKISISKFKQNGLYGHADCGGTLINRLVATKTTYYIVIARKYVLTAAHCLCQKDKGLDCRLKPHPTQPNVMSMKVCYNATKYLSVTIGEDDNYYRVNTLIF